MSERCGAKTRTGGSCGQLPIVGGTRCHWHGGSSPQAKAKAAERIVEQRARRVLAELGTVEPVTDAIGELERIAGQAVVLCDLLRGVVAELEEIRYRGGLGKGVEQVRGELTAYMAALARAESVLAKIVSLDLDARRVRIDELRAAFVVAAFADVLTHLGLDDEQQRVARALLARKLGVGLNGVGSTKVAPAAITLASSSESDVSWMS